MIEALSMGLDAVQNVSGAIRRAQTEGVGGKRTERSGEKEPAEVQLLLAGAPLHEPMLSGLSMCCKVGWASRSCNMVGVVPAGFEWQIQEAS